MALAPDLVGLTRSANLYDYAGAELVETRTSGDEKGIPRRQVRYQLANHLGSASLEVDDQARILSYEEYSPYGSTTYQAVRSQLQVPKRYRFTAMERDDESGLNYHSARYYAPWLGRWTTTDPIGLGDGVNLYVYARLCPTRLADLSGNKATAPEQVVHFEDEYVSGDVIASGEVRENETREAFASRVLQERFTGIDNQERAAIEAELPKGAGIAEDKFQAGATGHIALPSRKVAEFERRFDARARYQAKSGSRLAPSLIEGQASGPVDPDVATAAEIAAIGLLVVDVGLTVFGIAGLVKGAAGVAAERAAAKSAERGLIRGAPGASASRGLGASAPGPVGGDIPVPGRVRSRINVAKGQTRFTPTRPTTGQPVSAGFEHVVHGHFNRSLGRSRSVFSITPDKLKALLQRPDLVHSPVAGIPGGQFKRIVDTGEVIGRTALKFGGKKTSRMAIFTDRAGNLITAYPVP